MKNGNKILLGILTFIVVCVMGYALFSDTISVTGSATAKGSFDITTTCTPGYSDEFIVAMGSPEGITNDSEQGGFANSICNVNGNTVTLSTDLLYPTATRYFTIKMTNKGSIPAIIWGAEDGQPVESLDGDENVSWSLKNKETNEIVKSGQGSGSIQSNIHYFRFFTYPKFDDANTMLMDVIYDKEKQYAGIKLEPGESIYVNIYFKYPEESDLIMSDNGISEYFEFKLNHEFKWEQYTDSPNYEDANYGDFCFAGC